MRDPTILQAALSHAATHMDVVNCRELSKSTVMHTKHAIRLINQRLGSKPFIVNNELIEAVAIIASNSVSLCSIAALTVLIMYAKNLTGDLVESKIHMDALKKMVIMKGGRENLGDNKYLQAILSW